MRRGLVTKFYLPNLADEDMAMAVECLQASYDRGPKFAAWLMDALMDEQTRRLASRGDVPKETELLTLPAAEWTARELVQALLVVTGMSYGVRSEAVGRLVDKLVNVFTAAVGARLIIAEDLIHAIEHEARKEQA
jgi:hypothetical protein